VFKEKVPKISEAKTKEGILVDAQIKQLLEGHDFSTKLIATEERASEAYEKVCRTFLGNEKGENYSDTVWELISSYSAMGCITPLKLHFLHSHLEFFFPVNMGAISDEDVENTIWTFPEWKRGSMKNGVQMPF
jgi:hypothetical protein